MSEIKINPLQMIVRYAANTFVALLLLYLIVNGVAMGLQYHQVSSGSSNFNFVIERIGQLSGQIEGVTRHVWEFFTPFLQLALLFLIIDWLLSRFGIDVFSASRTIDWNVQTIIALIVVSAFAIASLANLSGVSSLKDVALVVVGFYFGSQKKVTEVETSQGKAVLIEEHQNPPPKGKGEDKATEEKKAEG